MKNKIKLFDRGVFWEAFNRLKIPGIIGSAILVSSAFILMLGCMVELIDVDVTRVEIPTEYFFVTYIIPFVIVPMMMMVAFSYLKARKTSDFYHAIPVKRETMFFSTIVAALAWIVGIFIIACIIPLSMAAFTIAFKIDMVEFWNVIGNVFFTAVLVLASFALGVSLTGNGFTNFFVPLMIIFVPRVISTIIYNMAENFTPFLVLNVGNSLLNNQYNVIFRIFSFDGISIPFWASALYTVILSAIYLTLGAIAFVKRKSEMAGQACAYKGVQIVSRMLLPFIVLLGALNFVLMMTMDYSYEYGYDTEYAIFCIALVLIAFTIYFIYELITTKRIKKVAKSLVWFPVLLGGVFIVGIIISIGSKISLSRDVDEDKINYLLVTDMCEYFEDDKFHKLYNEDANEIIADAYIRQMDNVDDYYGHLWYDGDYDMDIVVGINQGGITFYREIYLDYEEYAELYQICTKEIYGDDYKLEIPKYNIGNVYFDSSFITSSDEKKLYNILRDELKDISIKEVFEGEEDAFTHVNIYTYNYHSGGSNEWRIPISEATPKTLEAYIEMIKDNNYSFDRTKVYKDCLKDYEDGYEIDINLYNILVFDDDNKAEHLPGIGAIVYGDTAKETVEIFKLLEESEEGDNVIIFDVWTEIYEEDLDNYYYVNSISGCKKYMVTDEVLEAFYEYIEELEDEETAEKYYDDYYEDYEYYY